MCYHKEMATPEHVTTMKVEVAELLLVLGNAVEEMVTDSKMSASDVDVEVPLLVSTRNPSSSIHFVLQSLGEKRSFSQLLSSELMIRDMEMRRENLQTLLQQEATIVKLNCKIALEDVWEGAYFFLLMNTLPCILHHMENWNRIKLLTMILIEGLSNAKKKLLYTNMNAEGVRVSRFVANVENIVNRSMIGSEAGSKTGEFQRRVQ